MPKVSVIVPIYNVENHLTQCVESVLKQCYQNFEIILVDDGSTDNSGKIADKYATTNSNIISIHKENGGLSDARNVGIEIASGEYIYFLDSDDWLDPNAISTLLNFAIISNCEIVQGGFYYTYDDYLLYDNRKISIDQTHFILNRKDAMTELIKNEYIKNFAWGKLYKSSLVKKYLFPKGKYFEDSYWQHLIVNEINNYGVIPTPLYYYRQRESSISGQFNIKSLDLLKGYEDRLNFISNYYPQLIDLMAIQLWNISANMLLASKGTEYNAMFIDYWEYLNDEYKEYFKKAFNINIKYLLGRKCLVILDICNFYHRVYNRLFTKRILRISNNVR